MLSEDRSQTSGPINMTHVKNSSPHDASTPAVVRLLDTAGSDGPATPRDLEGYLRDGTFFWLDLEDPGDEELADFSRSLQLPADGIVSVVHESARSSFPPPGNSTQAVLPASTDAGPKAWLAASYVSVVFTEQFLLTVH